MSRFKTLNGYEVKDEYARTVGEALINEIGDLSNLETTDKLTIVGAINEVFNDVSGDSTKIGDLTDLHTTSKINIVSAINEVNDYAHNVRTVDLGLPDGQTWEDVTFWDSPHNQSIGETLNWCSWIYDIYTLQLNNALNYIMLENTTTNQNESVAVIGGTNATSEGVLTLSSQNVFRKVVEITFTPVSTSDEFYAMITQKGDDPTHPNYKVDKVYDIHGSVSYNDGDDKIQPLESVFLGKDTLFYYDDDSSSDTYGYYVLSGHLLSTQSGLVNVPLTLLITVEFSTTSEPQP